jgi:hypothetical protein
MRRRTGWTGAAAVALAIPLGVAACGSSSTAPPPGPSNSRVQAILGDHQAGLVGFGVNVRPAVRVTDTLGAPIAGATVTFTVVGGGGSVSGGTATTNAGGVAQVGKWTLGGSPGVNTLRATVSGAGLSATPATITDTAVAGSYAIQVSYYGPTPSAAAQAAVTAAVTRWQHVIYRAAGAITLNKPGGACGAGEPALNGVTTTGLLILATFDSIDGPGKILGQAAPCMVRLANGLSAMGVMEFDSADVAALASSGQLNTVMLHEMGHVIGFGILWGPPQPSLGVLADCLQDTSSVGNPQDTYFSCAKARAAFDSIGGTSYTGAGQTLGGSKVPVEDCANAPYTPPTCGVGTVNSHWRKTVFGNELMTGFISAGANPLSIVTAAAQEDIGYTVNYDGADAYVHAFTAPPAGGAAPLAMGDDIHHGPIYVVDAAGRVRAVRRR